MVDIKENSNYSIDKNGVVINKLTGKILKHLIQTQGYKYIKIRVNGKPKNLLLHRLLAEAFLPNFDNKPYINHKDGNKVNNTLDNLEWCTSSENNFHAYQMGFNYVSKQNIEVMQTLYSKQVEQLDSSGKLINRFSSLTEATKQTGVSTGNISLCCNGKRKFANGFKWRFV